MRTLIAVPTVLALLALTGCAKGDKGDQGQTGPRGPQGIAGPHPRDRRETQGPEVLKDLEASKAIRALSVCRDLRAIRAEMDQPGHRVPPAMLASRTSRAKEEIPEQSERPDCRVQEAMLGPAVRSGRKG